MIQRLRCIRCGDEDDMDPNNMYGWGLCSACWDTSPYPRDAKWHRWMDRWQKNWERHPTYKALAEALEAMESAQYGTLVEDAQ